MQATKLFKKIPNDQQKRTIFRAEVERNVILKEEGFVERRIHTRGLLTSSFLFRNYFLKAKLVKIVEAKLR